MARLSSLKKALPARVEQREGSRHLVTITRATFRRHGEQPDPALLHDLSIYGCRVASVVSHAAGERIWLRLASSMPIAATVMWSEAGMTGCRFDAPIDRALMRALTLPASLSIVPTT